MTGPEQCLEHLAALRRYAWLLTGERSRADDLVQDTLERACAKWSLWQPGTALRSWLFTLMHNLHLNHRRDWRLDDDHADLDDVPEASHETAAATGARLDMERALAQLGPDARAVLLLVVVEEYSYAEAALILGVPIGTVMSRLHRAREHLRRVMSPAPGEAPVGAGAAAAAAVPGESPSAPALRIVKR
jgi:RNA polymerase sigma-70 factor (ECF subfamily)